MAARRNVERYDYIEKAIDQGKSVLEIAKDLGINQNAVRRIMTKLGLKAKSIKRKPIKISHKEEEEIIEKYVKGRSASSIAVDYAINTQRIIKILNRNNIELRDTRSGKNHPMWDGGRGIKCGRWTVHAPDHPRAMNNNRVWERVVIMEEYLDRSISPKEPIHHIDIDPLNNEVENLYVCKDFKEHRCIHLQLEKLTKELLERGLVEFNKDTGKYYIVNKDKDEQ